MSKRERTPFGEFILRHLDGSRYKLAERAGIPRQHLYDFEYGGPRKPTHDQVQRLAAALDVDPDEVYAAAGRLPEDIERKLKHADAGTFRAVRIILS